MKNKKEISLLDIILLIVVFLLFDLVLIFYPAFPNKIFVTWLFSTDKSLILVKEIGIFVLPITILLTFTVLSLLTLFSSKDLQKKQFYSLKLLSTLFLLLLYLVSILKNIKYLDFSLSQTTALFFFLISFATGSFTILKSFKDKFLFVSQKLTASLSSNFIVKLIEGIIIIIIGITVLNTFLFQDWLKTIGFISFSSSISYGFFFLYLIIIQNMQRKQEISSLIHDAKKEEKKIVPLASSPIIPSSPIVSQYNVSRQKTLDNVIMPPTQIKDLKRNEENKKNQKKKIKVKY